MRAPELILLALAAGALLWAGVFAKQLSANFLFMVPVVNTVADSLIGYTNTLGSFHTGHIRSAILVAFVGLSIPRMRLDRVTTPLFVFLVYLLLLLPFASDLAFSVEQYHKVFLSLMMFVIAYARVRTLEDIRKLHVGIMVAVAVALIHFGMAQVLQIGPSTYLKDTIYFGPRGGSEVYITYLFAYAIVTFPFAAYLFRDRPGQRWVFGSLVVLGCLVSLLIFRRGALLAIGTGCGAYLLFAPQRRILLRYVALAVVLVAAGLPIYGRVLLRLYTLRGDLGEYVADSERGRMAEWPAVTEAFWNDGIRHALFGTDVLNSAAYFNVDRPVHIDFLNLLVGAGLVGLLLYFIIIYGIVNFMVVRTGGFGRSRLAREMRATMLGVVATSLTLSLSSQIWVLSPLSLFFLYSGALHGLARELRVPATSNLRKQPARARRMTPLPTATPGAA